MNAQTHSPLLSVLKRTGLWLSLGILFGISHTQNILYWGNQNTKLLHGLARAGLGFLSEDWTAQTADPLPFFSAFVSFTYRYLGPFFFYVYFVALLGVYVYSVMGIFTLNNGLDRFRGLRAAFFAAATLLYSGFVAALVKRAIGIDGLRAGLSGVAQEYLTGPIFQPSLFAVFLVLSILLFLRKKPFVAGFVIAFACTAHSAYLFSGATITVAYMVLIVKNEGNWKKALLLGGFTMLLVVPVLLSSEWFLAPTSPEVARRALQILVVERIPHHSLVSVWFDYAVVLKLLLAVVALYLLRGKDLFWLLAIPLVLGLALTFAQMATGSLRLAMLAPWRVSVFLVPLSELAIVASVFSLASSRWGAVLPKLDAPFIFFSAVVVALCFLGGLWLQVQRFESTAHSDTTALFSFVDHNKRQGDLYLVAPDSLDGLRLNAGVPVLVTWKTHPYKDTEVLEWHRRVQDARAFYAARDPSVAAEQLVSLRRKYGITHVVLNGDQPIDPKSGSVVYSRGSHRVVALAASELSAVAP
jgi:hypothetical protein